MLVKVEILVSFFFIEEVEILVAVTDFTHSIFSLVSMYIGGCNELMIHH